MKRLFLILAIALAAGCTGSRGWTDWERKVIGNSTVPMYVTVLPADSTILRTPSIDLGPAELDAPELGKLLGLMLQTVQHPSQDGVGIAAPQVGINRRIVCVMRYDKPDKPFETFVNIHIDSLLGPVQTGPEGCLSVPGMRGIVPRHSAVRISYVDPKTKEQRSEHVEGYTAIIFQHECDHLDGVLYIDRADSVFVSDSWVEERKSFSYERPDWFNIK